MSCAVGLPHTFTHQAKKKAFPKNKKHKRNFACLGGEPKVALTKPITKHTYTTHSNTAKADERSRRRIKNEYQNKKVQY